MELPNNKGCKQNVMTILEVIQEGYNNTGVREKVFTTQDWINLQKEYAPKIFMEDGPVINPRAKQFRQLLPSTIEGFEIKGSLPPGIPACLLKDVENKVALKDLKPPPTINDNVVTATTATKPNAGPVIELLPAASNTKDRSQPPANDNPMVLDSPSKKRVKFNLEGNTASKSKSRPAIKPNDGGEIVVTQVVQPKVVKESHVKVQPTPSPRFEVPPWCVDTDLNNVIRILQDLHGVLHDSRFKDVCLNAQLGAEFLLSGLRSSPEGIEILKKPLPRLLPDWLTRMEDRRKALATGKSNDPLCLSSDEEDKTYVKYQDELGIQIPESRESHKCLSPRTPKGIKKWVNSEIIDWWMWRQNKLIQNEGTHKGKKARARMHFFPPFFARTLIEFSNFQDYLDGDTEKLKVIYEKVKGKTQKKGRLPADLFDFDEVYFPVNIEDAHWIGVSVSMKYRSIVIHDSYAYLYREYGELIELYMKIDYETRGLHKTTKGEFGKWKISSFITKKLQKNTWDCGIYACMFAEHLRESRDVRDITEEKVQEYRQFMYDIIVNVRTRKFI